MDEAEAATRAQWRDLVERRLPLAAKGRTDWPVSLDHCFARILLDNAYNRPWRENVKPPAWRNTPIGTLENAIALGEAILSDRADLWDLNNISLRLRGKRTRPPSEA